jgi:hypothetical protein
MEVTLTYERNTRNSHLYTAKDYGGVLINIYIPKRPNPPQSMTVTLPNWVGSGGSPAESRT